MLKYFLILLFIFPLLSHSAVIAKIKGKRCFIYLEGSKAQVGDYFMALDLYGKARGLIRIEKIKNSKAIGTIVEGNAGNNWILEHTNQKTLAQNQEDSAEEKIKKDTVGILPSFQFNSGRKEWEKDAIYSGYGAGFYIFFEKQMAKSFSFRTEIGGTYFGISPSTSSLSNSRQINRYSRDRKAQMWYPEARGTFFFHAPLNENLTAKLGAGLSGSHWFEIGTAGDYSIINEHSFTWRHAGHLSLELNIKLANTPYSMPISVTGSLFQALNSLNKLFSDSQGSKDPVSIYQLTFYVGIAQPF